MYKLVYAAITIIWIVDLLDIGNLGAAVLDVQLPVNGLAWLLIWMFLPPQSGGD